MPIRITCTSCKKSLQVPDSAAGKRVRCPNCKEVVPVPAAGEAEVVNLDDSGGAPPPPALRLPPTMRANKALAGQICIICGSSIELGKMVRNCQECMTPHHQECWTRVGGCGVEGCTDSPKTAAAPRADAPAAPPAGPTRACPYCSEAIPLKAKKCPQCREWIDPKLREQMEKSARGGAEGLTTTELVISILATLFCSGIGFIVFLIMTITSLAQGKKKRALIFGIFTVVSFFLLIFALMVQMG